jgi:hypothetical protein
MRVWNTKRTTGARANRSNLAIITVTPVRK